MWPGTPVDELADGELHLPGLAPELPALRPGSGGPVETKRCPGCGQVKARSAFWRNARRSDGCATYCRDCGHLGSHKPPALLPTAPILPRLRVAVAGASYVGDPDYGVRRFARQMAATFGGDPEVFRVQLGLTRFHGHPEYGAMPQKGCPDAREGGGAAASSVVLQGVQG